MTTTYCYDRRGNVTSKAQFVPSTATTLTLKYTYNQADQIATVTYPSGAIVAYGRADRTGRVTTVTRKANAGAPVETIVSSATYYPFGPLNVLTYGNGRFLTRQYDHDYAIDFVSSSNATGLALDLTTEVMGNITEARDVLNATTPARKYAYDALYRLKQVANGASALVEGFAYNKTGDRTLKTLPGPVSQPYTWRFQPLSATQSVRR